MSESSATFGHGGLVYSGVLDAYRADRDALSTLSSEREVFEWLRFATILERAASLDRAERIVYLEAAMTSISATNPNGPEIRPEPHPGASREISTAVFEAILAIAARVEDANAFTLAMTILDLGRAIVAIDDTSAQARLTIQQARILRKLGELDAAEALLDRIILDPSTRSRPQLEARVRVGKAVIAQARGNYPAARSEFTLALGLVDESPEGRRVAHLAHHGLLVAAATAGDFDAALRHGGQALALAVTPDERAEIEMNLATVCFDLGEFRPCLNSYLLVLAVPGAVRYTLPAIGGAVLAAGRLGEGAIAEALASRAEELLEVCGDEYAAADMCRELFEAFAFLGDPKRAEHFRVEALARASQAHFHQIVHRLETFVLPSRASAPPVAMTEDAWEVAARLAAPSSEELLVAAISKDRSEDCNHYTARPWSQRPGEE